MKFNEEFLDGMKSKLNHEESDALDFMQEMIESVGTLDEWKVEELRKAIKNSKTIHGHTKSLHRKIVSNLFID